MIRALVAMVFGYLMGSFPSAILVGKIGGVPDIRRQGSGNPGAANALRVLGPLAGLFVLVLDFGKGWAAVALSGVFLGREYGWLSGFMAVVGHIYPVTARFRGGKGLASGAGAAAKAQPWLLAVFLPVWGLSYLIWRRPAMASAVAITSLAVAGFLALPVQKAAIVFLTSAVIFWRHWPEAKEGPKRVSAGC